MQGEAQGPEGPNQLVALTISISYQIPHPHSRGGRQKKMRRGFLLPVAVADVFFLTYCLLLSQQRWLQGVRKVCPDLAYCLVGGSQGDWRWEPRGSSGCCPMPIWPRPESLQEQTHISELRACLKMKCHPWVRLCTS